MATVKLTELMKERQLLSFELFPPKTDKGMENLPGTIEHLCEFKPEYISVTYGAGGGNVGTNREVCQMVKKAGAVPVTHFTVIKNTKEGIKDQLETYLSEGMDTTGDVDIVVPEGKLFVLGDNREVSLDSRYEQVGLVDVNDVEGKVLVRLYPFNDISLIK